MMEYLLIMRKITQKYKQIGAINYLCRESGVLKMLKIAGILAIAAAVFLLLSGKPAIGVICMAIGGGLIALGILRSR